MGPGDDGTQANNEQVAMSHAAIAGALAPLDLPVGERLAAYALACYANAEHRAWARHTPGSRPRVQKRDGRLIPRCCERAAPGALRLVRQHLALDNPPDRPTGIGLR